MASSPSSRRVVATAAAMVLGAGLAACASEATSTDPGSGTTPTTSSTTAPSDGPKQRQIDLDTALTALPGVEDMPSNSWARNPEGAIRTLQFTFEPKQCAAVVLGSGTVTDFVKEHRTVRVSAHFAQEESAGGDELAVYLYSHDKPYPLEVFDAAGAHMDDCHEFTETWHSRDITYTTSSVAALRLGDRTFGIHLDGTGMAIKGGKESESRLYVRSGHNLVVVVHTSDDGYDERIMEKYARFVLDDLGSEA